VSPRGELTTLSTPELPSAGCVKCACKGARDNEHDGRKEVGSVTETLPNTVNKTGDETLVIVCKENESNKSVAKPDVVMTKPVAGKANESTEIRVGVTRKRREPLRLTGKVEGLDVEFMCDTGAESTILSKQFMQRLSRELRQQFQDCAGAEMIMTNSERAPAYGPVLCTIECQGRRIVEPVYIADISDAALLGWDAQVALGAVYQIAGVDLVQQTPRVRRAATTQIDVRRVKTTTDCVLPPMSETLVPVGWSKSGTDKPMMITGVSIQRLMEGCWWQER
jgi:hypothetical protein